MKRLFGLLVAGFALLIPSAAVVSAQPLDPPQYDYYTSINISCSVSGLPGHVGTNFHGSDYGPNAYYWYSYFIEPLPVLASTHGSEHEIAADRIQFKTSSTGTWSSDTFYSGGAYASGTEMRVGLTVYTTPTQARTVASEVTYCKIP